MSKAIPQSVRDAHYLRLALALAQRGLGWASPNPLVGCVLVRRGRIIGRGAHLRDGEKHAEANALLDAGDALGATAYVSLEPCSHFGRQPSCCHMLAAAGVKRVVYGCEDADSRTAGRARAVLAGFGIKATAGVLQAECEEFLDYYLAERRTGRPFVHLKLALSLDGKVACASGDSQWLSGPQSLGLAHFLRLKYDALLVGWRTVLKDDPRLSVRDDVLRGYFAPPLELNLRQPVRVVLDPGFNLLPGLAGLRLAQLTGRFRDHLPALILAGWEHLRPQSLLPPKVVLIGLSGTASGALDLAELSDKLHGLGIRSLLVEGGGRVAAEYLRQQAVDKLSLIYTPKMIGSDGMGFSPALKLAQLADAPRLARVRVETLGQDAVLHGYWTK